MHSKPRFVNQAGVTAVEMLVCLAVMLQMMLLGASLMRSSYNHWEQTLAAKQLNLVSSAAKYYVQDHMETLLENWPDDEPQELSIAELQAENYLSTSFIDQNIFRQSTKIQLRCLIAEDEKGNPLPNAPKLVQILTYTVQGQKLSDTQARGIADEVGEEGGYLPSPPFSPKGATAPDKVLVGSCKGWLLDVSTIEELRPGHPVRLVYVSSIEGGTSGSSSPSEEDFLRRIKSANTSRYNIMETHLGIQDGASIQFLKPGVLEISDTADEESTSIRTNHFRLNKQAYWDEEGLQLSDQVSFKDNKLIFIDETGDKRLEIGIDGIEFTAPESNYEITEEGFLLENASSSLTLSPSQFEIQDLKKSGTYISLGLSSNGPALTFMLMDESDGAMVASAVDLKFSTTDFSPLLNLSWVGEGGLGSLILSGSGGLQIFDPNTGAQLFVSAADGKSALTFREYKAGITYLVDNFDSEPPYHWPP